MCQNPKTSPIDRKSSSKINPKSPRPPLPDTPNFLHRPYKTTGHKRWTTWWTTQRVNDLIGQDGHAVAMSLSPCAQRGRCLFSFLAGMLSQHGCILRDGHVTLSYQMLGMLGTYRYPACVLLDRLIIIIINYIIRYYSLLRDIKFSNNLFN